MKKLMGLLWFIPLISFAQNLKIENSSLQINGEVQGLSENSAVLLVDGNKMVDTIAKTIYGQGRFKNQCQGTGAKSFLTGHGWRQEQGSDLCWE
jgi:hypothetical protein